MPYHLIQASFNGGEISKRLQARVDQAIYQIAAGEIVNMVTTVEGPAVKTPGTRVIADALASASWLSTFIFSATQAYVLEWGEAAVRFYTNDGRIETAPGVAYEVAVPYAAAAAKSISAQQSNDVLYLAADGHQQATLSRTGAETFAYAALDLKGGPFKDRNSDKSITVSATGAFTEGGAVTLFASSAIFEAGHVGGRFRLEAEDFSDIPAWEPGVTVALNERRRSDGKAYRAVALPPSGRTGSIVPTHTSGDAVDGMASGLDINAKDAGGVTWRYEHDQFGIVKLTGVAGASQATGTVERTLPSSLATKASHRWAMGAFSAAEGWPHLVVLAFGRLWFIKDRTVHASVAGSYRDFSGYNEAGQATPDMAFSRTIDGSDPILWTRAHRNVLVLGGAMAEYVISRQNPAEPLSGDNIAVEAQTFHGSAEGVPPLQVGKQLTLFVQRGARKLRGARYELANDGYVAENLTRWARQIGVSGFVQLAYQAEPEEMLFALRGDGVVTAHPIAPDDPDQQVKGWSRAIAMEEAAVKSIASIPSPDAARDDLWLLVERTLPGGAVAKTVEKLDRWWDEEEGRAESDAFFLHSGLSLASEDDVSSVSGLNHLAGLDVAALVDGAEQWDLTVAADGSCALAKPGRAIHVGRPYTARVTTLRPEVTKGDGTSQTRLKRVVSIAAFVLQTFGVKAGSFGGALQRLTLRKASTPMGSGPSLIDGSTEEVSVGSGWGRDGRTSYESRSLFPWILQATVTGLEQGDR